MISMTIEQKEEFRHLVQQLNDAHTVEEAQVYSDKLQLLIAKAEEENPTAPSPFTAEQLKLYIEYKEQLKKAKYPKKVRQYQEKIRALLAEIEQTVI